MKKRVFGDEDPSTIYNEMVSKAIYIKDQTSIF